MTRKSASNRPFRHVLYAWTAIIVIASSAQAQTAPWKPDHSVTLVVPYAPGGGTDATARAMGKQLSVLWGQPVVVENMPGADGLIGTRRVMDAKPDGYTFLLQVPAIVLTKYTPGLKGIDPLARLEPVTAVSQSPNVMVISAKVPVSTLAEFVQFCKAAPQPCSFATGETTARIMARQLAAEAGLPNLIVVSYRGTGAMVTDMIANNVNIAITGINATQAHHKAGTLKILATMDVKRARSLPEIPTTAEAGYPQFLNVSWFGLFAPKGTSPSVAAGVVAALREAAKDPDFQRSIAAAGAEPVISTPAEFARTVSADSQRLDALVKRYPLE